MREIKFRAINHETGKFVYGHYIKELLGCRRVNYIIAYENGEEIAYYIHDIDTLGQFIGLKDICESDIHELKLNGIDTHIEFVSAIIEFDKDYCAFCYKVIGESGYKILNLIDKNIISRKHIGNIHENPELLK